MTIVAWDGKTLAADRRSVNNGHASPVTKIARAQSNLVGWSGHLAAFGEFRAWLEAGCPASGYPDRSDARWWNAIVIDPNGVIQKYEDSRYPIIIEATYAAIGSGRDFALAAMHLGHDARAAVEITCALSVDCGDGIDTLTLAPRPDYAGCARGFLTLEACKSIDGRHACACVFPPDP